MKNFQNLLTSNIWNSSSKIIKEKLNLPYWDDPKYQHLLTPSIFSTSLKNIIEGIELLEEYNIGEYVNTTFLRGDINRRRILIEYLIENNIHLIVEKQNGDYKLNPILSCSNTYLKRKYNIDINNILKQKNKIKKIKKQ